MKVLHLNTYDGNGGAGRACLRLNKALNDAGIDSEVLVFYKFGNNPQVLNFSESIVNKAKAVYRVFSERYWSKWLSKPLGIPFSLQWFGTDLSSDKQVKEADIIHIHWINHGFMKPETLAKLDLLDKPIVWTFHDSNAFTGGCHVRYTCEHYHRQCGNCPVLKSSGPRDLSNRNWNRKQRAYSELNFSIVAPSHWMKDSVKFSSLLGTREVNVIPNTLESQIFKPYVKAEAKKILKIAADKFVIMAGFMPSKNDKHKGSEYLEAALKLLADRPEIDNNKIEFVVFGNKTDQAQPEFPFKTTFLGTVSKDDHLAKCYSAADVFVVPSLEDNLPNTVMESLACATPVVGFRTGGIPDMVRHLENGYLAAYASAEDLADGIEWIYFFDEKTELQKAARKTVLDQFSEQLIASRHIDLYTSLLKTYNV